MENEEPSRVPRQTFKIMKDRMWRHLRILSAHFHTCDADETKIKMANIQQMVNQAFEKHQELLNQWEVEKTKQSKAAVQRLDKCTRNENDENQPGVHAVIEGDIETGILTYEQKNEILVMPNPSQTPLMVIKIRRGDDAKETQALGMPDTGSHMNTCSESFAKDHGLKIVEKVKTNLKAANGQHLTCVGATKAKVSYHGVQLLLTIYVMKDVPNKYVIISKDACQGFGILPRQFPLPLRLCDCQKSE